MRATSVRLEEDVLERLDRLAAQLARPRSWLISRAIQRYLDHEEWFGEAVREGVDSADADPTVDHGDVARWVESWGTGKEVERPK